jgi:general secretion pathway protein G
MRFLRRLPRDPFTGTFEWGVRSDQDDPASTSWGGQNVFDIYPMTTQVGSDGTPYSEW